MVIYYIAFTFNSKIKKLFAKLLQYYYITINYKSQEFFYF